MFHTYANMSNLFFVELHRFPAVVHFVGGLSGVSCGSDGCSRRPCTKPSACGEDTSAAISFPRRMSRFAVTPLLAARVVCDLVGVERRTPAAAGSEVEPLRELNLVIAFVNLVKFLGDLHLPFSARLLDDLPAAVAQEGNALLIRAQFDVQAHILRSCRRRLRVRRQEHSRPCQHRARRQHARQNFFLPKPLPQLRSWNVPPAFGLSYAGEAASRTKAPAVSGGALTAKNRITR